MNYLAHIVLARHSSLAMVGALMGDFVKADLGGRFPFELEREITLHRRIDSYTDQHRLVRAAVQRFAPERRRYAGILLDVFFDHLLSQRWAAYCPIPREQLIASFYHALDEHHTLLPEKLRGIAPHMIEHDWLGGYLDFAGVEWAIVRMSQRLSRNGHLLREGLADLRSHYGALGADFDLFFPELISFAAATRPTIAPAPVPPA